MLFINLTSMEDYLSGLSMLIDCDQVKLQGNRLLQDDPIHTAVSNPLHLSSNCFVQYQRKRTMPPKLVPSTYSIDTLHHHG